MGPSDVSASSSTELKVSLGRPGDTRGRNVVEAADEGGARGWRAVTTVDDGGRRATEGRPVTRAGAGGGGSHRLTALHTSPAAAASVPPAARLLAAPHGAGRLRSGPAPRRMAWGGQHLMEN